MTKKKILCLEDLVQFFEQNKFNSFSSKETGYQLVVHVPSTFEKDEDTYDDGLLMRVKMRLFHIGLNRNKSSVTEEAAKKAMQHLAYKPILANFCETGETDEEGNPIMDFTSHDIIITDSGTKYLEHQIGCITADEPWLEYDEDLDKTYVCAYGAIPREYTDACSIIERKGGTKTSVELLVNEMQYSAKEKVLELTDVMVQGETCLGIDPDSKEQIGEGMLGSRIDIAEFNSKKELHYNTDTKLIETLDKLNDTLSNLSNFNIENAEGKEEPNQMKFEELLAKYGKTIEDITFEYEGLSDEDLEIAFAEAFEDDKDDEPEKEVEPEVEETFSNKWSITDSNGTIHEFELSLDEIQSALYNLVNDTYSESDDTWYSVSVYDSHVIMHDWWNGKNYKQTYKREDDNFSLTGDREEVFANWLTKSEEEALTELRSNYASIESELNKYKEAEADAQKEALFTSKEFSIIFDEDEFKELANNHKEYSYDELKSKLDSIVLSYAKSGNLKFSNEIKEEERPAGRLSLMEPKKVGRYGNLFSKK